MNAKVEVNDLSKAKYINEAPKTIFWPSDTERFERLVKVSDDDNKDLLTVRLGDQQYLSDILLNVETEDHENDLVIFNVNDFVDCKVTNKKFCILGNILFIDKNNNHVILTEDQYVKIGDVIFYMPKDIYLTIDLRTGNCVFANANRDSELRIKYLAFFLMYEDDYEEIEKEIVKQKTFDDNKKQSINSHIEGYNDLSEEQKQEVNTILDKLIYNNEKAHIKQFVSDNTQGDETSRLKIPLKEDGTVDVELFTNKICPKYAEKHVDLSTIEFEKENAHIPFISEKDYTNLGLIGFSPKETKELIKEIRNTLIDSHKNIIDLEEKIESIKTHYDKSLSTCASLISTGNYDSARYEQIIKNNYTPLAMMKEYENQYKKAREVFDSARQTLASFQTISRQDIQKSINDGEFTNKHTFSSLVVFFKTMLIENCISGDNDINDNYGVYNAYLKYINKKNDELNRYNYLNDILLNSFDPNKSNSIYSLSIELLTRFVRISDLQDLSKIESLKRIMERVENRIDYLFDISYFPISITGYTYPDLFEILSFTDKNEEINFNEIREKLENKFKPKGWPTSDLVTIENNLVEKTKLFKSKIENPIIFDSIIGFLKMIRLTVINEYFMKINTKRNKTNGEIFKTSIIYNILLNIVNNIDNITTKKAITINDKNEEEKIELSDSDVKCLLGRWLVNLVCYISFASASLRLSNKLSNTISSIEKINEHDAQTFFSVIINGLILSIEVLDTAIDKGEDNTSYLDTVISPERLKLLGNESSKIFYSGLKGMYKPSPDENNPELFEQNISRLFLGRKELMEQCVKFTEVVFDVINKFIDSIVPEEILKND
jgi:hypothetical protein